MPGHAVWVHGTSVRAQWAGDPPLPQVQGTKYDRSFGGVPWTDIVGLPEGPGATYRGRTPVGFGGARAVPVPSAFFHFSIPTPVFLNDAQARLVKAFVLYRTDVDSASRRSTSSTGRTTSRALRWRRARGETPVGRTGATTSSRVSRCSTCPDSRR